MKSQLCNKMDHQWLNDPFVTYVEIDVLLTINNDIVLSHFQQNGYETIVIVLHQTMLFLVFNKVCIIVSLQF
jgi:hypothetical protein